MNYLANLLSNQLKEPVKRFEINTGILFRSIGYHGVSQYQACRSIKAGAQSQMKKEELLKMTVL